MIESSIVYKNLKKHNFFRIGKAEGSLIWDREGKRYIDFTSGWNVTNLGWNHPEVKEAMVEQINRNVQGLLWGSDPIQEKYAEALTSALPKELNACAKATGGTEAIEESIKIARAATGRKKIAGFLNSYHGQLFASLAIGYPPDKLERIRPLMPEVLHLKFPAADDDLESFKKYLDEKLSNKDVAGLVTEPGIITGWGDTRMAPKGFLKAVREITKKYGTLLIIDEVGTGFSRTGKLFAIEHEGVVPDMIVFAKGISNGAAAIGTVVGNSEMFKTTFPYVNLISTFGWTPIACAAALKTLEIHQRDKVWEQAEQKGKYMREKLNKVKGADVHGMGMEIGVTVKDFETAKKVVDSAFKKGLQICVGNENNIQLMPPLNIPQELLDEGLEILINALK